MIDPFENLPMIDAEPTETITADPFSDLPVIDPVDTPQTKATTQPDTELEALPISQPEPEQHQPWLQRLYGGIKEMVTGKERKTPETEAAENIMNLPELVQMGTLPTLSTLTAGSEETARILKSNYPDLEINRDENGNILIKSVMDGKTYAMKPGIDPYDISKAMANIVMFGPAGKLTTVGLRMLGSGLTALGFEALQSQTGGRFDPGQIPMEMVPELPAPAARTAKNILFPPRTVIKEVIPETAEQMARAGIREIGEEGAEQLMELPGDILPRETARITDTGADPKLLGMEEIGKRVKAATAAQTKRGQTKAIEELATQAPADPKLIQSAEELDIMDYLQPEHITTNQGYREIAQAIKSIPGSKAKQLEYQGLQEVAAKADDLIKEFGGTDDFSVIDRKIKDELQTTVDQLAERADDLYSELREKIQPKTPVQVTNIINHLENRADELGGMRNLSAVEQRIYRKLKPTPKTVPATMSDIPDTDNIPYIRQDLQDAELGQRTRFGAQKQRFPDWWQSKIGWNRADISRVFDKIEAGEPLTDSQKRMYQAVMKSYKNGNDYQYVKYLRSEDIRKHLDNIDADSLQIVYNNNTEKQTILDIINTEESENFTMEELDNVIKDAIGFKSTTQKIAEETAEFETKKLTEDLPSYALLDDVRKDIVAARYAEEGPFRDAESGKLKQLETLLRKDQELAANTHNAADLFNLANKSVAIRKNMEKDMAALFGKKIDSSLVTPLIGAVKALPQGDAARFTKLIKAIPKQYRQEVAASGLAVALGKSARNNQIKFGDFANWHRNLKRNTQAYNALMVHLPKNARSRLQALANISDAINKTSKNFIATGRLEAARNILQGADSLTSKIYQTGLKSVKKSAVREAVTTLGGLPGAGTVGTIAETIMEGRSSVIEIADELISKPSFIAALKAPPNQKQNAINILVNSRDFKKFASAVRGFDPELDEEPARWVTRAITPRPEKGPENDR